LLDHNATLPCNDLVTKSNLDLTSRSMNKSSTIMSQKSLLKGVSINTTSDNKSEKYDKK